MTQKELELIFTNLNIEYNQQTKAACKLYYDQRDAIIAKSEEARKEHNRRFEDNMKRQKDLEAQLAEKRRYGIANYSVEWQSVKTELDEVCALNRQLKEDAREREKALKLQLGELHREYEAGCIERRILFTKKKGEATRLYIEEKNNQN